jgi:hypothetical protein
MEELQADRSRADADLKEEGRAAGAIGAAAERERTPAVPQAAPAPRTAAPAAASEAQESVDTFADATAQRYVAKATTSEAAGADPMIRWRIVSSKDVERSVDGGKTWVETASPPGPLVSIRDVDERRATITAQDGRTFTTADGGATWAPVQEKPAAPF